MYSEELDRCLKEANFKLHYYELIYILSTSPQIVEPRKIDRDLYGEIVIRTNENQNWNMFITNK